jgi:murein DD-endopeptidase MepM/ murein hydrolase activator NlpD
MRRLSILLSLAVLSTAVLLAFGGRWPWQRLQERVIESPVTVHIPAIIESRDTLRRGETLGELFGRQGLLGANLVDMLEQAGLDPRRLRAGMVVNFRRIEGDSIPHEALVRTGLDSRLAIRRVSHDTWTTERRPIAWRTEVLRFDGDIQTSLYDALDEAIPEHVLDRGSRTQLAWQMADVYAWSIDFSRDIQPGDRFAVLLERLVSEEGEVRQGRIYAADLLVSGKHLNAFRFDTDEGTRYYDESGNSLRKAFLRAPVEFRRISSNFSRSRYHPVLGVWRKHSGTDYSAASGTPVMAAGEGVVQRAGRAGGYGNLVEIRHRSGITTRYAHLRGFSKGVRAGTRVRQGQIIGYVGATGLASGPHLHYEFLVNGTPRDSRRIALGNGEPVAPRLKPYFLVERDRLLSALGTAAPSGSVIAD